MPKAPAKSANTPPADPSPVAQFEQSLAELESLVAKMEGGELDLEEALRCYERGTLLYRTCQTALEQAEARVKLLLDPEHPEDSQSFAPAEDR